jgi:hypothetical protein
MLADARRLREGEVLRIRSTTGRGTVWQLGRVVVLVIIGCAAKPPSRIAPVSSNVDSNEHASR